MPANPEISFSPCLGEDMVPKPTGQVEAGKIGSGARRPDPAERARLQQDCRSDSGAREPVRGPFAAPAHGEDGPAQRTEARSAQDERRGSNSSVRRGRLREVHAGLGPEECQFLVD